MLDANDNPLFEIFPWNSNFSVGIGFIDEQHKRLVELLNKVIWQFVTFNDNNANETVLGELIAYTRYHFDEEERLWHKYFGDKSLFKDHARTHEAFFTKIKHIQQDTAAGETCTDKLIEYLTNWLAVHILHSDRRMAMMVQEIDENGTSLADAEKIAKAKISQAPVLQSSIVELYNKLSNSAAQLIREKNARIDAQQKLQQVLKQKAEQALESQAQEYQSHLEFLAYNDPLTGLLNRNGLLRELREMMNQTSTEGESLAVISINLDFFGQVSAQLGSEGTNRLLGMLARRWQDALLPHGALAHMGSDDFVVIVKNSKLLPEQIDSFFAAAGRPFTIDQWQNGVSFTAGVSFYPQQFAEENLDADKLLRQADYALYQAKQECRGVFRLFDIEEDRQRRLKNDHIAEIRHALEDNQFVLHYQPKVDMRTGELAGIEALIRWQHPESGLLAPAAFLPYLEKHPFIIEVGEWVIEAAIKQMLAWEEQGLNLNTSVNIDALQIQNRQFPLRLKAILNKYPGFNPNRLDLEILETVAINDIEIAVFNIQQCREFGVTFSLDDFGKGYCSLSYLKQLPVDTLKIDQAFVRDMLDDASNVSILEGIVAIAKTFNLKVVAEGVESIMHGEFLIQIGCEFAQGYSIARPMPSDEMHAWLSSWQPCEQWQQSNTLRRDDILALTGLAELNAWLKRIENANKLPKPADDNAPVFQSRSLERWMKVSMEERPFADMDTVQNIENIYRQLLELGNKMMACDSGSQQSKSSDLVDSSETLRILTEQIRIGLKECLKHRNKRRQR
jgi:hemerythrin-like metal-binding protein/diguanylate cyclase (GGDEF)-like protein